MTLPDYYFSKVKLYLFTICFLTYFINTAQVGIGTTTPQASLDISSSTNGGVLITKYALTGNNDTISVINPAGGALQIGTLVFNTNAVAGVNGLPFGFVYWNGSIWVAITPKPAWQLEGNTISNTDFIGTLNNFPFNIHVNNNKRFGLTNAGQIVPFNPTSSVLFGVNTTSTANYGISIGQSAATSGFSGIAIGQNTRAAERSIAIGENSEVGGLFSLAIGPNSQATRANSISIGSASNTISQSTVAIGTSTMASGVNSIAIGNLSRSTMGSSLALGDNSSATSLGATAIGNLTRASGFSSTTIGDRSSATGQNSSAFGERANASAINSTAIGNQSSVNTPNTMQLGNTGLVTLNCRVALTVTSDKNYKYEIKNNVPGLDFITKLKPVTYKFDTKKLARLKNEPKQKSNNKNSAMETGFLAQDVAKTAKEIGYNFNGIHIPEDETKDSYGISYSLFVVPLVKAVQEQQDEISSLKEKIEKLEKLVERIDKRK